MVERAAGLEEEQRGRFMDGLKAVGVKGAGPAGGG